jgi:tetratricopeptide (TPR) repeat protein
MRLHDARGDRARALRVYHACAATLERELGVEPAAATREAYEALLPATREAVVNGGGSERLGGPPLVGRAPEWARLTSLWRATEGGRAQLVLVSGEPGIGKTRLVEELRTWCAHRGAVTAEARSYAAEGALPYRPVVTWLRSEPFREQLGQLNRAHLTELARLLPELLVDVPGLERPESLPEPDQRQRLFDAVARVILAPRGPLLIVADDLQWCDRETLQFLHYLLRVEPAAPLLVAATARREETDSSHPLHGLLVGMQALDRCTEIPLDRLTHGETAALAEQLTGRPVAKPDADRLYDETEGSPLFVVEALRAGWHGGRDEPGWLSPKVQAAIEARLAQLSEPARELVGLAATVGRAFTTDVLADASEAGETALVRGLDELWQRRIIREQGADAYDFSHDKIREAAYLGLSPPRRRHAHLRVARALERLYRHDPGPVSGQLAAHFEQAGATDEAVAWYIQATEAAQRLHANREAVRLLERALDLLDALPITPERRKRELAVLTALPTALGWVEGWSSDRLAAVHQRALDLVRSLGDEPAPPLLRSLAITGLARRTFAVSHDFGRQLQARAIRDGDDMLLVEAAYVLGIAAFWEGEFEAAKGHFETAVDRFHAEQRSSHLLRYGLDPQVICMSRLANTLWFLGHPDAARRTRDAALALAEEVGHPNSHSTGLVFAIMLSLDLREPDLVRRYWATLATEFDSFDTIPTRHTANVVSGYLDVLDGWAETGIARAKRALDEAGEADHAPGGRACLRRVLLEACAVAGAAEAGLAAADQMLASGDPARLWEAECRRLRAEFLAALGAPPPEIEAELERALQVASRQRAPMLELRTLISLLRYRLAHGPGPGVCQAREALAATVGRLRDGGDSLDLRDAVALLERC